MFPGLPSDPAPATFRAVFVAGSWGVAVRDMFVASNCLCVRELLNILAANGEQGESGSGWCTGSCAPPTCLVCLIPRCPGHVWGRFCSRACLPTPPRPRFGPFLFPALPSDPLQRPLLQCQSICVRDAHEHLDFREEAIHHFFVHFEDASDLGVAGMVVIVQQFG